MKDNSKLKKGLAVAGIVAVGLGLAGAGALLGANAFPKEVTVPGPVITKEVIKEVPVEEPVEVIKEVPVNITVEKIVEVDNGNLDLVLQHVFDADGKVQYLTKGLKDSEVAEIADRIIFINEAKVLAQEIVDKKIADLVDKEVVGSETLDEDDVEKVKVEDEFDKILIDDVYFDDKDVDLLVPVRFEHDDVDYEAVVKVIFKDGEYDDVELVSLNEE